MGTPSTHRPRALRCLLALALLLAALVALSGSAPAQAATAHSAKAHANHHKHKKHRKHQKRKRRNARKSSAPLSGIYDACSYSDPKPEPLPNCTDRLAALAQGGFQVVLNYWSNDMSVDDNVRYAQQAESLGIKVIFNLSDYRHPDIGPKLDLVNATKDLPATWGYYIGDEVDPSNIGPVQQLSSAVRGMTRKPLLFVSRPNPSKLAPFKGLADYVGPDDYPNGPYDPPVCQTSRWASKMSRNSVMTLQAYSWSVDFPSIQPDWPSAAQMRQYRDQATRCGHPKLLMWFAFHVVTDYNPDPSGYYRQLAWAANGVNLGANYRMSSS
jgi:hypothetical protein